MPTSRYQGEMPTAQRSHGLLNCESNLPRSGRSQTSLRGDGRGRNEVWTPLVRISSSEDAEE
ncbi:MAG: hypothetical protein QOG85_595 [Gaiellaceae bacterium]|jgi:hypothetical protein|nr:hypothetical protein [Gaiellaceae bacterium]